MVERVSFSDRELTLEEIAIHHADVQAAIFEFFAGDSPVLLARYAGSKREEPRNNALAELDMTSSLSVLSSVEAAIRLDYLRRVYGRWRDPLSKAMKSIYSGKGNAVRLEDDLICLWRDHTSMRKVLLGELVAALNYRHWLAHGRYWTPKFGRRYDYVTVFEIAQEFMEAMEAYGDACENGNIGTPQ